MADTKTIKIAPLSDRISKEDVQNFLSSFSITRVHKSEGEAFVEL